MASGPFHFLVFQVAHSSKVSEFGFCTSLENGCIYSRRFTVNRIHALVSTDSSSMDPSVCILIPALSVLAGDWFDIGSPT